MTDDEIMKVFNSIRRGIDRARKAGVVCDYPSGAIIQGRGWVPWPWKQEWPNTARAEVRTGAEP